MVRAEASLSCREVEAQVVAYLKAGLPPDEHAAVRAHLLHCERCSQTVHEARELDEALFAAAPGQGRPLPPEMSARIQSDLYRRLRRALLFQRLQNTVGQGVKVAATSLVLLVLALWLLPWLRFLAGTGATPSPVGEPTTAETELELETELAAPALPRTPTAVRPVAAPSAGKANAITIPRARQLPASRIEEMFGYPGSADHPRDSLLQQPAPAVERVWQRVTRCTGVLELSALGYETIYYGPRFVNVRIALDEKLLGEVKLWLGEDGEWYPAYLNYASFSALEESCQRRRVAPDS